MIYQVVILPGAQRDIDQAYRWQARRSPHGAVDWHCDLLEAIKSLETFPFRCPLALENRFFKQELRQLLCGKYRIIFTVSGIEVHVLRVRHSARKPLKPQ